MTQGIIENKFIRYILPMFSATFVILLVWISQLTIGFGFRIFNIDIDTYEGTLSGLYEFLLIILLLVYEKVVRVFYKDGNKCCIRFRKPHPLTFPAAIVIAFGLAGVVTVFMLGVEKLSEIFAPVEKLMADYSESVDRYSEVAVEIVPAFDKIMNYISMVVLAPIAEELCFRGIVMEHMLKEYHPALAIILSSVPFALLHGTTVQALYAFFSGCVLGLVCYYGRSIWASITVHSIFNFIGGALIIFLTDGWFVLSEDLLNSISGTLALFELYLPLPAFFALLIVRRLNADKSLKSQFTVNDAQRAEPAKKSELPSENVENRYDEDMFE